MSKNIVCGRFDNYIDFPNQTKNTTKIRLGSTNPNKLNKKSFILISTDGISILYKNKKYLKYSFFIEFKERNFMVLTNKEKELVLDAVIDLGVKINVFEELYPIFDHIKYISNIYKNYYELEKLIKIIDEMGIKGKSLAHYFKTKNQFKIERKIRFKNNLDTYFAFAYKGPYQEVFKLKEERTDRVIVALDYNSMFSDCMKGEFLDPKSIYHINFEGSSAPDFKLLNHGLYKVILKRPLNTFFRKFHPFVFVRINNTNQFNLEAGHNIEILLFKNELLFYKKHFEEIEIIEGFVSKKTIQHPLIYLANKSYKARIIANEVKDVVLKNYYKFKLVTLHSASNPKIQKEKKFISYDAMVNYLNDNFMIKIPEYVNSITELKFILGNNKFLLKVARDSLYLTSPTFNSNESLYCLSSQVLANSRLKMMKTIEKFLKFPSLEICYINTDSIHVSILKSDLDNFIKQNNNIISNKMGDLKIEAISDKGYWFDVGRYWLINNNKNIILFKNRMFNFLGSKKKFIKVRKHSYLLKGFHYKFLKPYYIGLFNSFSYKKKIHLKEDDHTCFSRYNYDEIYDFNVANKSYDNEALISKSIKSNLFNKIATD